MNEEGWGLRDIFAFLAIVCIAILVAMVLYNRTFKDLFDSSSSEFRSETYTDIEADLEQIAHTYTDNYYYKILESGDEDNITLRDMQEKSLLTEVKDIKDDNINCTGYVHFKTTSITTYKAYIKCGDNYKTEGYQAKYDEPVKTEKELTRERISG